MQNSGSPQLDLTGKLIIKVALGDDIRRIPIHNEDITYDELVLMMQRVYRGKLSTNDEITIKYKDEDGDLITIFDSSDLTFAIQCSRILKITLFTSGSAKSLLEPVCASSIRRELQDIRDRVVNLLDRLETTALIGGAQGLSIADGIAGKDKSQPQAQRPANALGGKEFDPLSSQKSWEEQAHNKVAASFGMDGNVTSSSQYDRAATPDSISSIGSSASNQVKAQQNSYQPPPAATNPQQQQQQVQQQQPIQQQQQQIPSTPQGQPSFGVQPVYRGQAAPLPQSYAGQPGYGVPQPVQQPVQQQQQQEQVPQHQQQISQQQQSQYDASLYGQYNAGYQAISGQPALNQPTPGHMMYGQPGLPSPGTYNQAPGMPQVKGQAYPPNPTPAGTGQSPNNPYSRGGYGGGYPRPSAGYPQ
ncbi:protein TFG-like isoform X2 [Physella acuta]|uniref:protein TFG-like isoform X2 n=1 Tax=Physella acuta TaxID=109671 RepID=UPI0027DC3875|nr:protein TFG-like isoform X2 [Physella acuta]